ncbi:LytTR family DNA-binding domain-containing protein [Acholeplasma laidlawii]
MNRSYIVNISKIKSITPLLGMQFNLHLVNNQKLKVSRNYYYQFKDKIGF